MECSTAALITSAHFIAACYIFLCLFALGTCTNDCPHDEQVNNTPKYLTSSGYPNMYKRNKDCYWRLTSTNPNKKVKIQILDIDIEYDQLCEFDYLEIYDGYNDRSPSFGKFCGKETFTIVSSGMYLYFYFHTDDEINGEGFKFKYKTVDFSTVSSSYPPPLDKDEKDRPLDPGNEKAFGGAKLSTLVGGLLGGLCLLVVVTAVCCMCSTRICRRCRLRNNGRQRTSVSPHSSVVEIPQRNRPRRSSPPTISQYNTRRANNHIWSTEQNFPMVPINPPPYSETENQPVYLVHGVPGYNSYFPPSSPPPTYSCGLSSDSNPPAYDDDRNSPPNYVPDEENPPRY